MVGSEKFRSAPVLFHFSAERRNDDLDRLVEAKRGVYTPGSQAITNAAGSQKWELDTLGNWSAFKQDTTGDGDYADANESQDRDHNMANELYQADRTAPGSAAATVPLAYDDAGNMTDRHRSASLTTKYVHDAWNRLVRVDNFSPPPTGSGTTTISAYEYNGLHWRTVKRHDTTTPANGLDQQTQMYYDASWRLVEERIDENYVSSSGINRHMQNLWGARYIDDLIARRRDANKNGTYSDTGDATFYAITDVQFSVVAMLTSTGKLHERVAYDSYGTARHHWKDDVDGDGDVDSSDKSAVTALLNKAIYQSGYNPAADIDRSGTIDSADASLVSSKVIAALPAGEISDRLSTGPDSNVGYDGYVFNSENLLYTVRFRHYDPSLGRWLERDPAGYVDGMSLYAYAESRPISVRDPMGLDGCDIKQDINLRAKGILPTRTELRAAREAARRSQLAKLRKNGISTTDDFMFWYHNGDSQPIHVSPSLEKEFRDHELIQPVIEEIKNEAIQSAAQSVPCNFECKPGASWTVTLPEIRKSRSTVPYGSSPSCLGNPRRNTYSYGKGFLWARVSCRVTVEQCSNSGGTRKPTKVKVRCNAAFRADDKFEEPLGIPNRVGGDALGDPYWFTTRWDDSFSGSPSCLP